MSSFFAKKQVFGNFGGLFCHTETGVDAGEFPKNSSSYNTLGYSAENKIKSSIAVLAENCVESWTDESIHILLWIFSVEFKVNQIR